MEVNITDNGNLELLVDKWDIITSMLSMGFTIALVVVVIVAAVKLGWRYWPWVLVAGALAFMFV
tara:strand:- start:7693 stop:7884 length:192 start_codon:yes stop_codon:yes gene_type:complete